MDAIIKSIDEAYEEVKKAHKQSWTQTRRGKLITAHRRKQLTDLDKQSRRVDRAIGKELSGTQHEIENLKSVMKNGFVRYDHYDFNWYLNPNQGGSPLQQAVRSGKLKPAFWQKNETGPGILGYATKKALSEGKSADGGRVIPRTTVTDFDHLSAEEFNKRAVNK